jgi:succinate dehydrogenase/fumarate reductase flavoprotein subunit
VHAKATVLASGGIGAIYADSTYPADVASDSFALAHAAGASLIDMEFVQFEPTVVVHPAGCRGMEMPTAMLGDGARLLDRAGQRFMFNHNPGHGELRIEKARMALAIQQEIDRGNGLPDATVLFDTTVLAPEKLESYVGHCRRLRAAGLDPAAEAPRVRPAAHSVMGGIRVDATLRTDAPNLFAAGEAAGGVHGASRLAGNGAADVIVFGGLAGRHAAAHAARASSAARDRARIARNGLAPVQRAAGGEGAPTPDEIRDAVRATLLGGAGLYRSRAGLEKAIARLEALGQAADAGLAMRTPRDRLRALEAANMVSTGLHVARSALARTESRGAHQRTDHAARDDANWLRHVVVEAGPTRIAIQ